MSKLASSLESAVAESGLRDGMRISFHHHLRLGDRVVPSVLPLLTRMGFRDLTLCASSLLGLSCEAALEGVRAGTVRRIETTGMKEPLSAAVVRGEVPEPVIFRSHGGRARAIEAGETPIDVAFIAASAADRGGHINGVEGPNRFGSMGYAMVDAEFAGHVIAVTDNLVDDDLRYVSIPAAEVDQVVVVDSIGNRELIGGGSLRISRRPVEQLIGARARDVLQAAGMIREGLCFQAGSGGISLIVARLVADTMRSESIRGAFASGGATGVLTRMLKEGLFSRIYDVQCFDDEATLSLLENPDHIEMSAAEYANPDRPDCIAHRLDLMVLSATEVDVEFNVNSLTGTDGRILGALGGAPDTAEGAGLTMVVLPTIRGRIPTVCSRVDTVCTPGQFVDVLVTERGVCVNPGRSDIEAHLRNTGITTTPIAELRDRVYAITGAPRTVERGGRTVGVVESRRGDVLDTIASP